MKTMKYYLILYFFVVIVFSSYSQTKFCGTVTVYEPAGYLSKPMQKITTTINIPVVFHVIYKSDGTGNVTDAELQVQLDTLNGGFEGSIFTFFLAGISRTKNDAWHDIAQRSSPVTEITNALSMNPENVLNVYIGTTRDNFDNERSGFIYWWPWSGSEYSKLHGVFIHYLSLPGGMDNRDEGNSLIHEVGHYLGLFHTFEGGCQPPGDKVDDTPYHNENTDCAIYNTCPQDGMDPIENYMNYTPDDCMYKFTTGQRNRMNAVVAESKLHLGGSSINLSYDFTISGNQNWQFYSYVNINSGWTLTCSSGSIISFASDQQLVVHGKIDADKATFQELSGSPWYGIVVDGTPKSYFDSCTIKGGKHGLVVGGSTQWSPEVKYCYIQGRNDGIWIKEYGNPYVAYCNIKDSIFQAVKATNNANGAFKRCKLYGTSPYGHKNENSATTSYNYYGDGRNIIDGAAFTTANIYALGGNPQFASGYNSIHPRAGQWHFLNSTGNTLYAGYNYWGGGAPDVIGTVNYSPFLGSPPVPVGPGWDLPKTSPGNDAVSSDALAFAWKEYSDGNYHRSKQLAQDVFQTRKETEGSSEALFLWMKSALMEGSLEKEETNLSSLSTNSAIHQLANYESLRWLAKLAVYRGDFKRAEEYALSIPNGSLYGREILLDLAVEILERWGDIAKATSALDKLTELYPDDETIREKESVLSSYGEYLSRNGVGPSKPSPMVTQQEITSTNLFQAFPNPFNPITTIAYRLAEPGKVSLKVFDLLGREVTTLVDGEQNEGEYSQRFDASHLSSGIYFCRLIAPGINQTKKMLLAK